MKNFQNFISIASKIPHLAKLSQFYELERLKVFLPKNIKMALLFITIKHNQILFAFKNPVVCNEFNRYLTKNLEKSIQEHKDFFSSLPQNFNIKGYVPLNLLKKQNDDTTIVAIKTFEEKSLGNFKNNCKDEKLYKAFEELRDLILNITCIK
ncbi:MULTISPECIES: hypothetical protein [unclassified Helicobacter]|uniref:hypothetical protein n=1 Tax=unclassified Helicobacter TaxID=2593540 RepID=UPI000CF0805F|nr:MULTISPECIES: hypothetical protein [unclassified Helicobacter]